MSIEMHMHIIAATVAMALVNTYPGWNPPRRHRLLVSALAAAFTCVVISLFARIGEAFDEADRRYQARQAIAAAQKEAKP